MDFESALRITTSVLVARNDEGRMMVTLTTPQGPKEYVVVENKAIAWPIPTAEPTVQRVGVIGIDPHVT